MSWRWQSEVAHCRGKHAARCQAPRSIFCSLPVGGTTAHAPTRLGLPAVGEWVVGSVSWAVCRAAGPAIFNVATLFSVPRWVSELQRSAIVE